MLPSTRRPIAVFPLVVLLFYSAGGAGARPDDEERLRPYERYLPGTEPAEKGDVRGSVLVRDAATGRPIEGARVRMHFEDPGELQLTAPPRGVVFTDEYGIANSPGDTFDFHVTVDAPGYAPKGHYPGFPRIVELEPGVTAEGIVVDTDGTATAGLTVEYYLGCPHSPAAQRAVTDAEGRFRLAHANPDGQMWAPGRAALSEESVGDFVSMGRQTAPHVSPWFQDSGAAASGRVVDTAGKPLAECIVRAGSRAHSRGPATRTDAEGRFELARLRPDASLRFFHRSYDGGKRPLAEIDAFHPTVPIKVVAGRTSREPAHLLLTLKPQLTARVVCLADGVGVRALAGADGVARLRVAPGRYRVFFGTPFDGWEASPMTVDVGAKDGTWLGTLLAESALLVRTVNGTVGAEHLEATLWCEGYAHDFMLSDAAPIRLPRDARAFLEVADETHAAVFPVELGQDGTRRVTVNWPAPTRIRISFTGSREAVELPEGPMYGRLALQESEFVFSTRATGSVTFDVRLGDAGWQRVTLALPDPPGGEVLVGAQHMRRPPDLEMRVLLADGTPAGGQFVHLDKAYGTVDLDSEGRAKEAFDGVPFGDTALVEVEGHVPRRVAIKPGVPNEIRMPSGTVELEVTGADGAPLDFAVYLDGWLTKADGGHLRLRGIEPGLRTLIVGAPGCRARAMRVRVPPAGVRRIQVVLPERRPDRPR